MSILVENSWAQWNAFLEYTLQSILSNLSVCLKMFHTAPATVVSAETNFSKLRPIQNYLWSTMGQGRLNNLDRVCIESDIAKQIDFDSVFGSFAKKACKVTIF